MERKCILGVIVEGPRRTTRATTGVYAALACACSPAFVRSVVLARHPAPLLVLPTRPSVVSCSYRVFAAVCSVFDSNSHPRLPGVRKSTDRGRYRLRSHTHTCWRLYIIRGLGACSPRCRTLVTILFFIPPPHTHTHTYLYPVPRRERKLNRNPKKRDPRRAAKVTHCRTPFNLYISINIHKYIVFVV